MRLMAVDDDMVNRIVIEGFLQTVRRSIPFNYEVCESGTVAIQRCNEVWFDLIFMDIMMPVIDGIETISVIKDTYKKKLLPDTLFVMVTACEDKDTVLKCKEAGSCGYLLKPVRKNEIIDWIQLALVKVDKKPPVSQPGDIGL